jgi:hypothetical protein
MVLLSAWLMMTAAADGPLREPVVVLVSSKRAGAESIAREVAASVRSQLMRESARTVGDKAGTEDASACQGQPVCLRKIAAFLGPHALVIGVDVGKSARSLAIHLDAVTADAPDVLATAEFLVPVKGWKEQSMAALSVFVHNVVDKLPQPAAGASPAPAPAPGREDAPVAQPSPSPAVVVPSSSSSEPAVEAVAAAPSASTSGGRIAAWCATAGAAVGLGLSSTFLVLGLSDQSVVSGALTPAGGGYVSSLDAHDLRAYADRGNLRFTISLATGLLGLALAALAGVLFVVSD